MQAILRLATGEDWQTIQKLNAEVYDNSAQYDQFLRMDDPYSSSSIAGYKKEVSDPDTFCMIAEVNGHPAGYLVGKESNYSYRINKRAEINHMGVSPTYRAHGLGSKLIIEFKKWCKSRGLTHIAANTYYRDDKARHFYEKNGLVPIDITLEGPVN